LLSFLSFLSIFLLPIPLYIYFLLIVVFFKFSLMYGLASIHPHSLFFHSSLLFLHDNSYTPNLFIDRDLHCITFAFRDTYVL
jgi:hypothetical protein